MAELGATTLTGCSSIPDFIATGTRLIFAQAAAPTGWTRITDDDSNNRMLRVVSSGGGGVGGSASPILNNVVPVHTHSFTTGGHSVDHSHSGSTGFVSSDHAHAYTASNDTNIRSAGANIFSPLNTNSGVFAASTGGINANHFHTFSTGGTTSHTHSGTTDNGSSSTNWAPRYIDMILCSKN